MSQYTRERWKAIADFTRGDMVDMKVVEEETGRRVATIYADSPAQPFDRADLIAADPELLEALCMAEPILIEAVAAGLLPPDDPSDRLALDAVRAAIAKANGEN